MVGTIVVAIDGGAASDAALSWAIDWAKRTSLNLDVCAVADRSWSPEKAEHFRPTYQRILEKALDRVAASAPSIHVTSTLRHGHPAGALVNASRAASLLVVGTNKTGALSGLVHGTLPLKLAAEVVSPLVVVPTNWEGSQGRVVVGVDGDTDPNALDFAAEATRRLGTELLLVHAWDVPSPVVTDFLGHGDLYGDMERGNSHLLDSVFRQVERSNPGLKMSKQLIYGNPSVVFGQAAEGAALAVVGTHHRHAIAGMLLGSVGHDLLMNMPSPVAIVPPDEPERVVSVDDFDDDF